jgi:hypothetical protein
MASTPDEFEVVVHGADEAERRSLTTKPILQFQRGVITVAELSKKLEEIATTPLWGKGVDDDGT